MKNTKKSIALILFVLFITSLTGMFLSCNNIFSSGDEDKHDKPKITFEFDSNAIKNRTKNHN